MDSPCEKMQDNLADYVLGVLSPEQIDAVNEHIGQCTKCNQYVESLKRQNHLLTQFSEDIREHIAARQDKVIEALNAPSRFLRGHRLSVWKTIMKNNITKLTAAVLIFAVLIGVYQMVGTRAAFAETTRLVRTTLAGLRAFVSGMRSREPVGYIDESKLPPARSVREVPDVQGTIILAEIKELAVVGEQNVLQDFCKSENVAWIQSEDNANMWYASLDHTKTDRFTDFVSTCEDLQLRSSPRLMLLEGQEGTIGSFSAPDEDAVALALVATVLDDDEGIELSFCFLRGRSGFEVPSLRIEIDEAVLFRFAKTVDTNKSDNDGPDSNAENVILVFVQIEVRSPE